MLLTGLNRLFHLDLLGIRFDYFWDRFGLRRGRWLLRDLIRLLNLILLSLSFFRDRLRFGLVCNLRRLGRGLLFLLFLRFRIWLLGLLGTSHRLIQLLLL